MASLFAAALALTGCGIWQNLRTKAATDLGCPQDKLEFEEAEHTQHARGCGREAWYLYKDPDWVSPLDRAVFETGCPREQLTVTRIDNSTFGVAGCGQRVVYLLADNKWVLDSAQQRPAK